MTALLLALLAAPPEPAVLTREEAAAGWLMLFDGHSTFGWSNQVKVEDGKLVLTAGDEATVASPLCTVPADFELRVEWRRSTGGGPGQKPVLPMKWDELTSKGGQLQFFLWTCEPHQRAEIRKLLVRPTKTVPLFDGKTLTGWTRYTGDEKREKTEFSVTPEGELQLRGGPGDLRTDRAFGDFLLQFDVKTNAPNLNSGVFFRCVPGQYQNGYEAQVHFGFKDGDRTKPFDFGTGAIYRRVPARRVVGSDGEWVSVSLLAVGPHLMTWVNGYPVVSWTDDRPPNDNPRQGRRTAAGHISLQGHDPTTDVLFRNIRVAEVGK